MDAPVVPVGVADLMKHCAQVDHGLSRTDSRRLRGLAKAAKVVLKERLARQLEENPRCPLFLQYSGDCTPVRARGYGTVGGEQTKRKKVSGSRTLEFYVHQIFSTLGQTDGSRLHSVMLGSPLALEYGKSMPALLPNALQCPGLRFPREVGRIVILHQVHDRAMALSFRQSFSGALNGQLAATSSTSPSTSTTSSQSTSSSLLEWHTSLGSACHDGRNSLRWASQSLDESPETLKNAHVDLLFLSQGLHFQITCFSNEELMRQLYTLLRAPEDHMPPGGPLTSHLDAEWPQPNQRDGGQAPWYIPTEVAFAWAGGVCRGQGEKWSHALSLSASVAALILPWGSSSETQPLQKNGGCSDSRMSLTFWAGGGQVPSQADTFSSSPCSRLHGDLEVKCVLESSDLQRLTELAESQPYSRTKGERLHDQALKGPQPLATATFQSYLQRGLAPGGLPSSGIPSTRLSSLHTWTLSRNATAALCLPRSSLSSLDGFHWKALTCLRRWLHCRGHSSAISWGTWRLRVPASCHWVRRRAGGSWWNGCSGCLDLDLQSTWLTGLLKHPSAIAAGDGWSDAGRALLQSTSVNHRCQYKDSSSSKGAVQVPPWVARSLSSKTSTSKKNTEPEAASLDAAHSGVSEGEESNAPDDPYAAVFATVDIQRQEMRQQARQPPESSFAGFFQALFEVWDAAGQPDAWNAEGMPALELPGNLQETAQTLDARGLKRLERIQSLHPWRYERKGCPRAARLVWWTSLLALRESVCNFWASSKNFVWNFELASGKSWDVKFLHCKNRWKFRENFVANFVVKNISGKNFAGPSRLPELLSAQVGPV